MKSKFRVYLAGPITGLSYEEARNGWRAEFPKLLPDTIHCYSPMRGKDFLKDMDNLGCDEEMYREIHPMVTQKGITTRDRYDVQNADAVVMNLIGADRVSIGSMIEIGWADSVRVPIILIMDKDNVHDHMMVLECAGYVVETIEEAAHLVKWLFSNQT